MTRSDIRTLRKTAGLTQTELAERSGIARRTIAELEKESVPARLEAVLLEALAAKQPTA